MFLLDWYKQYLEIKKGAIENKKEETICQSCETLREQLAIANYEKSQVLNKLLKDPEPPAEKPIFEPTKPKMIPWNVRRQMLEREDREKARALRSAAKPDAETEKKSTEELEKELDIVATERESQTNA